MSSMRARFLIPCAALAACAAPPQTTSQEGPSQEMAGRSMGTPERCVQIVQSEALRVSDTDPRTLVYGSGKTIWVNHVGCGFALNDVLISEPIGSSYCRGDMIRSFDRATHTQASACPLGDFIPYTR